ncbi:hypothetical protein DEI16_01560 [Salmonella enterica subsp. enterica serovar Typhi]|uniref:Uncharacterized protein n=2 Tax=Salmonella typhi TaxID=90370 RepID=A0A611LRY8_SALTI|nr:hypothetical protein [Salmonella enterica]EBG5392604.1 hypothetical protein [Salmonella enterica subsp. enterica serovar Typhi]HAD4263613.1 hypothetical protein [Salmonella enterica subsp. enterica serovar Typhi str. CT18]HAD7145398.1 hypothetical protein [Salmonella enterica subsp. enterica serovar Typhimurium str. SL1344]EAR3042785.1 hypothetical protein [Salmonella enterica]
MTRVQFKHYHHPD